MLAAVLLDAMAEVARLDPASRLRLRLIGPVLNPDDVQYDMEMRSKMWAMGLAGRVDFVGFVPQERIAGFYATACLHLNVSQTGSMDKTVLEALACGCPVLTGNEAFRELLSGHPEFLLDTDDPSRIARRILDLEASLPACDPEAVRALVAGKHDQEAFVGRVLAQLESLGTSP